MKPTSWSRLDIAARSLVPSALTVGLVLAGTLPVYSAAARAMAPALPLIAVFFWTLSRPELMPAAAVFAIGLLSDILSGLPIGIGAGVLVGVHAVVTTQRPFFTGKSFGILWLGFALVAVAALLLGWLLTCLYYMTVITPERILLQIFTTIGFFPVLCWLLLHCQVVLPEQA